MRQPRTAKTLFTFGLVSILCTLLTPSLKAQDAQQNSQAPSFYSVSKYDPQRNPEEDLKQTIQRAQKEGKHILLQVGGDWCGWCSRISRYYHDNQAVEKILTDHYVVMKVNFSNDNNNTEFLDKYPNVPAFPHLFVLDSDGNLLHSQGTGELEKGNSYSETAMVSFLNKWIPEPSE